VTILLHLYTTGEYLAPCKIKFAEQILGDQGSLR